MLKGFQNGKKSFEVIEGPNLHDPLLHCMLTTLGSFNSSKKHYYRNPILISQIASQQSDDSNKPVVVTTDQIPLPTIQWDSFHHDPSDDYTHLVPS